MTAEEGSDAIRYHREAVQLDPRSPDMRWNLAGSLISTRRYEEADRILDDTLTIAPDYAAASITKAFVKEAWKPFDARLSDSPRSEGDASTMAKADWRVAYAPRRNWQCNQ